MKDSSLLEPPAGWQWMVAVANVPLIVLIAAGLALANAYPQLPDSIPFHYGPSGQADAFAPKSHAWVFGPLVISFGLCLSATLFFAALVFRTPPSDSPETRRWRRLSRRAHLISLLVLDIGLSPWLVHFSLLPLTGGQIPLPAWVVVLALLSITPAALIPIRRLIFQPGWPGESPFSKCWKLRIIYCNPGDPALLVEKRNRLGYTLNFGNPLSWLFLALPLLSTLGPILFMASR